MLKITHIGKTGIEPYPAWPSLQQFKVADKEKLEALLRKPSASVRDDLQALRGDGELHNEHVMATLATLYAHFFDYLDAPDLSGVEDGEAHLVRIKRIYEEEMIERILFLEVPDTAAFDSDQNAVADYIAHLSLNNFGVKHEFFDYIADDMPIDQIREFLWLEVIRNEVVDDEVAMLVPGLQHSMKQVVASNLWDECGNGKIDAFHTTWLVRLLSGQDEWNDFIRYRESRPWHSAATSNSFNSLLTNPANRFRAYGTFIVNESWVADHFERILRGMTRVGIIDDDRRIYFDAHYKIDQHHREELIEGLRQQFPALKQKRLREVIEGAHQAVEAGVFMYDKLFDYFVRKSSQAKRRVG